MLALAWGLTTIKNIQTHVGFAAVDDGANEDRVQAPDSSKGGRHVSFHVEEVDGAIHINTVPFSPPPGSTVAEWPSIAMRNIEPHFWLDPSKGRRNVSFPVEPSISAIKAKQDTGATSSLIAVLKAEREELAMQREKTRATIAKLGKDLVAARANGHQNDSTVVKTLKATLQDLRRRAQRQEQRATYLEDTIVEPKGYVHLNTAFKESFRFRTASDKGSSRGRLLSTEDDRSLSSESSSPTRASKSPLATRQSSSPTRAANPPLATRQGSFASADDEIIFQWRSVSAEGMGSSAVSLSSESSSPTRASKPPLATRQSSSPTRAANPPVATSQQGSFRGRMRTWSTGDRLPGLL
ncbi:hypothetical protein T484DRAFT_1843070 [Baffinella frigidus]|nr:hypothetical protein T484DRAFT_1843070 [Cryptophyta sp. CCMP2293]